MRKLKVKGLHEALTFSTAPASYPRWARKEAVAILQDVIAALELYQDVYPRHADNPEAKVAQTFFERKLASLS